MVEIGLDGREARRPDTFLIGAPKCGTTSLYEYLRGHPQIYMSQRKEPQYFDVDPATSTGMRYGADLSRYLSLFADAGDATRVGEASTVYLWSPVAPQRLHDFQPQPYLIVALRDPVEMLHALHGERLAEGVEPLEDFRAALADEPQRESGARGKRLAAVTYRPRAQFAEQLERWFATFGRDRLHVIIFEDFVADPDASFRRLLDFLQVDPTYRPPAFATFNASRRPRSRLFLSLLNARRPRDFVRRHVPMALRNRVTLPLGRFLRRLNTRGVTRGRIDPDLRRELQHELRPGVERLGALLGMNLVERWWGKPA